MPDTTASRKNPKQTVPEKKFKDMSVWQKSAFVCKAAVFVITFGLAFPHIFSD